MLRKIVLLASAAAVVAAVVWGLGRQISPVVGYNGLRPAAFVGVLKPHRPVCMQLGTASSRPDRVRVTLGAQGAGPPIRLTVAGAGRPTVVSHWTDGPVDFALPSGRSLQAGGLACFHNLGRERVEVAGEPGGGATIRGKDQPYGIALQLVTDHPPTWADEATGIVRNVGSARAGAGGPVTGWVALVLFGAALGGALLAAARWAR